MQCHFQLLLRKKAAEELKREQERKAEERRWIIDDRCGEPEDLEWSCKGMQNEIYDGYFTLYTAYGNGINQ